MEPKKYEYIDCLRGIAILLVIINHVNGFMNSSLAYTYFPDTVVQFIQNGKFGVQLFFIVSAYTLILSIERRKDEVYATRNFFIRRFFRIAPMYYIAILYFTLAFIDFNFVNPNLTEISKKGLILSTLFLNGILPSTINSYVPGGWSITVEFSFYFILPFLSGRIRSVNKSFFFVVLSFIISIVLFYLLRNTWWDTYHFLEYYFFTQLPVFALGIFAYYWLNRKELFSSNICIILLTVLIFLFLFDYVAIDKGQYYGIMFFFLLLALLYNPQFLKWGWLSRVGRISFSLYLIHFIVIDITNRSGFSLAGYIHNGETAAFFYLLSLFMLLGISIIVSAVTYKYIELPGQALGRNLIKYLNGNRTKEIRIS